MSEKRLTVGMRCPQIKSREYDENRYGGFHFQEDVYHELSALFGACEKEAEFEISAANTTVKAHVDILCRAEDHYVIAEVKSGRFDPLHIWQVSAYRYIVERALKAHVDAAIIYPTFIITDSLFLARALSALLPTYYIPHAFNDGEKYVVASVLRWKFGTANMGPWCAYCENAQCRLKHVFNTAKFDLEVRRAEKRGEESEDTGAKTL